ncbi:hypothetical protein MJ904_22295 [Massilia sp. MB5]|uniref:hypothetical protein n=1 Tax=Massilia sp. MB5 TaxID=2919578 RepID=UPI001F1112A6|nr:hypothetical protein [Massilia sp. MB5]UMR29743.1 hypothetical protein MJ904_22295 [Massilia sp. MB5]
MRYPRYTKTMMLLAACLTLSAAQAQTAKAPKPQAVAEKKTAAALAAGDELPSNTLTAHAGLQSQYGGRAAARGFHEVVDPYSGNLTVKMEALTVPGNGGQDIAVGWTYKMEGLSNYGSSSPAVDSKAAFSTAGHAPWQLDVAPLVVFSYSNDAGAFPDACQASSSSPLYVGRQVILQTAGGRSESFYFMASGIYETKSHWRLSCDNASNTHVLRSPDGSTYRLGMKSEHSFFELQVGQNQTTYQTTRVTDRNGNYYDIAYQAVARQQCVDSKPGAISTVRLPSQISASDGRVIKFNYDLGEQNCGNRDTWRSPRLQSVEGPDGAVWRFEYHPRFYKYHRYPNGIGSYYYVGGQLAKVIQPDGTSYAFSYPDSCPTTNAAGILMLCDFEPLKTITLPTGGTSSYTYRTFFDFPAEGYSTYALEGWSNPPSEEYLDTWDYVLENAHMAWGQPDVLERRTSDGGVWTYSYDRPISKNVPEGSFDTVTIDGPAGREVRRFYGLGYFTPTALAAVPAWHNVCNTKRPEYNTYCGIAGKPGAWKVGLPVDLALGDGYRESYVYQPRVLSTADTQEVAGRLRVSDSQVLVPDLQSKTIVLNGVSFTTSYANYDAHGNAGTITEAGPRGGNRSTSVAYYKDLGKWILKLVKDESFTGSATTRSFDGNGNLLSVTTDGVKTSYTYDSQGNVASATFPRNLVHSYSNYKRGIPQSETQPEGVQITRTVSAAGAVLSETNGEGKTRSYGFDSMNRMTSITYPLGNGTSISYSANGKTMTRGSLVESTVYDGFGRPQSVTLGGITRSYSYDALGRKTFESHPGSSAGTGYQYDILNRPTRVANSDGSSQTISYVGVDKTVVDERNNATTQQYRAYGNLQQLFLMGVVAAEPAMNVSVARNARDLTTSVSQGGLTRSYGYNGNYYLTSVTNPETGTTTYGRDEAGNMTSRQVGASGQVTFGYDGRNRVKTATYPSGTPAVSYTYTKTDKIKTVSSSAGNRVNDYDANDNLSGESVSVDGLTFSTGYAYNANDQLDSMTYPRSGRVVSFVPDVLGRPTQVSGYVTGIGYWPSGQISQINYANGTSSTYRQHARLWPSSFSTAKGGAVYFDNSYDYDGVGNLTTISNSVDGSYNRSLGYDGANRLTSIAGPWGAGSIQYDGAGNIKSQTFGSSALNYSYDGANRLDSIFGERSTRFTYDAYGNVSTASGNTYAYDDMPNLRCVNCANAALKTEYSYDGANRRLVVNKAGVKSYEIYGSHGNQLIEFTPSQSNKLIEYFYLGGKRIAQTVTP